eukprot:1378201-Prymnesium_polylepis.1
MHYALCHMHNTHTTHKRARPLQPWCWPNSDTLPSYGRRDAGVVSGGHGRRMLPDGRPLRLSLRRRAAGVLLRLRRLAGAP